MKKLFFPILTIFYLLLPALIFAQQSRFLRPDYDKIEQAIKVNDSPMFYTKLMDRFLKGDSTMTIEEKQHLYYGFTFQKDYSPYKHSKYFDSVKAIVEMKTVSNSDCQKLIIFSDSVLKESPFDMRMLNYQMYAFEKLSKNEQLLRALTKIRTLIDAIVSTGDGTSMDNALFVIYISHEYDMLEIMGLPFGGKQKLIEHFDYLTLEKNDAGLEGMYFDISPSLNHMSKMFKD